MSKPTHSEIDIHAERTRHERNQRRNAGYEICGMCGTEWLSSPGVSCPKCGPTQTEAAEMEKAAKKFLIERGWSPRHSIIASDVFMMDMADFALSREREAVRNAKVAAPIGVCTRHLGKHSERIGYDPCLNYTAAPQEAQSAEQSQEQIEKIVDERFQQLKLRHPHFHLSKSLRGDLWREVAIGLYRDREAYSASQNAALTKERDELRKEIERLKETLQEISEGKGRFSLDHFQHAKNTIEDMKSLARAALDAGKDGTALSGGEDE